MDHEEFKKAREQLGLSLADMGKMLGPAGGKPITADHIRKLEASSESSRQKPISQAIERLMQIYLSGYRPPDWPDSDD